MRWNKWFEIIMFSSLIAMLIFFNIFMKVIKDRRIEYRVNERVVFLDDLKQINLNTTPTIYEYYEIQKVTLRACMTHKCEQRH